MSETAVHDVVIAGAGPNGLMLACELSLAGIRPLVLEQLPERTKINRANGIVGQIVRMMDRRGLYQRLTRDPRPPQPAPGFVFGALPLDFSVLEDNPMYGAGVPQLEIERVLEERALELGVGIRRGWALSGFSQDADTVTVDVDGPAGASSLTTRYLVGADGGKSATRKLAGIEFPGVTREDDVGRMANVTVGAELVDPVTGGLDIPGYGVIPPFLHHRTETGVFAYAPFPGRPVLVSTMEREPGAADDEPMTLDELRVSIRRVLGVELPLGPPPGDGPHILRRVVGGNTRVASRYRVGRVLLVGDAAHVHSAIGGPGLNLGLQDTINLAWKLAAELHGHAPDGLLDTYEAERRPVSERVVLSTQAQSALVAPGSEVTALRGLVTELLADPHTVQHLADLLSGADIRYPMGTSGTHPLIGRWAPDLVLENETGPVRLASLTVGARPILLDTTEDAAFAKEATGWQDRVDVVTGRMLDGPATVLLLRPDCYLAWATSSTAPTPAERDDLRAALARWFGPAG